MVAGRAHLPAMSSFLGRPWSNRTNQTRTYSWDDPVDTASLAQIPSTLAEANRYPYPSNSDRIIMVCHWVIFPIRWIEFPNWIYSSPAWYCCLVVVFRPPPILSSDNWNIALGCHHYTRLFISRTSPIKFKKYSSMAPTTNSTCAIANNLSLISPAKFRQDHNHEMCRWKWRQR